MQKEFYQEKFLVVPGKLLNTFWFPYYRKKRKKTLYPRKQGH
ncbi:hypothetical protein SSU98_0749 [Streptococcus suis 98HAH33]|nr:hypothetical protein SSU98_0749 [Streptococcus suis 98HAH33]